MTLAECFDGEFYCPNLSMQDKNKALGTPKLMLRMHMVDQRYIYCHCVCAKWINHATRPYYPYDGR